MKEKLVPNENFPLLTFFKGVETPSWFIAGKAIQNYSKTPPDKTV